mgnify:CR=1 FL=1
MTEIAGWVSPKYAFYITDREHTVMVEIINATKL